MAVEPLTKRSSGPDGKLYERVGEVEAQIEEVVDLPWPEVVERLQVKTRGAPRFLREETLVYLCRRAHRSGNPSQVSVLYRVLLERIEWSVTSRLKGFQSHRRETAAEAIRSTLLEQIFNLGTNRGDFLQVAFFQGLVALIKTEKTKQRTGQLRDRLSIPLDAPVDDSEPDGSTTPDAAEFASLRPGFTPADQATVIREHLALITNDRHREAFLLRHRDGLQVAEVAEHMGVTPKTIFNWLTAAEATLAAATGGSDDVR